MKTQILSLIILLMLSVNLFAEPTVPENKEDNVDLNKLGWMTNVVEDESLEIESWMINDDLWNKYAKSTTNDVLDSENESIPLQSWMTDSKLWKLKREVDFTIKTVFINGVQYRAFKVPVYKDRPVHIQKWMIDEKLWML